MKELLGFFFFNDTATTEIYTLSLHDALPIYPACEQLAGPLLLIFHGPHGYVSGSWYAGETIPTWNNVTLHVRGTAELLDDRSEEHTSELQSRQYLVCRLLLEKKKIKQTCFSS